MQCLESMYTKSRVLHEKTADPLHRVQRTVYGRLKLKWWRFLSPLKALCSPWRATLISTCIASLRAWNDSLSSLRIRPKPRPTTV